MPPEPGRGAPGCIARLEFLSHEGPEGCRPDLKRSEFAHYLVGEGKGPDGALPLMFAANDDVPKAFRDAWMTRDISTDFGGKRWPLVQAWCADIMRREMIGEPWHMRLMVSPEARYGKQVDLQEFARELISRVESDCFRQLHWVGSAHYNTENPHVHFGIRGLDQLAEPVFFHKQYVRDGFRWRAKEILREAFAAKKQVRRAG